jgi:hypothetical protein
LQDTTIDCSSNGNGQLLPRSLEKEILPMLDHEALPFGHQPVSKTELGKNVKAQVPREQLAVAQALGQISSTLLDGDNGSEVQVVDPK